MAEQSHLEAMREAIRGDLERARSRRPSIFERPAPPPVEVRPPMEPAVEPEPPAEPATSDAEPDQAAVEPEPEPVVDPVGVEPVSVEPEAVAESAPEEPDPEPDVQAPVEAEQPTPERRRFRLRFWRA